MSTKIDPDVYAKLSKILKELLVRAADSARKTGDTINERIAISDDLNQFIADTYPDTPEIDQLDAIAKEASIGIMKKEIQDRVQSIQARHADYAVVTKHAEDRIARNNEAVDALRLTNVSRAFDAATETVEAFNKVRESLGDQAEEEVREAVEEAAASIKALRELLVKIG